MCPKPGPRENWAVENVQHIYGTLCERLQRQTLQRYQQESRENCSVSVTCGGFCGSNIQSQCQRIIGADWGYTEQNIRKEGMPPSTNLHNMGIPYISCTIRVDPKKTRMGGISIKRRGKERIRGISYSTYKYKVYTAFKTYKFPVHVGTGEMWVYHAYHAQLGYTKKPKDRRYTTLNKR